jgi:hypothetical protein
MPAGVSQNVRAWAGAFDYESWCRDADSDLGIISRDVRVGAKTTVTVPLNGCTGTAEPIARAGTHGVDHRHVGSRIEHTIAHVPADERVNSPPVRAHRGCFLG